MYIASDLASGGSGKKNENETMNTQRINSLAIVLLLLFVSRCSVRNTSDVNAVSKSVEIVPDTLKPLSIDFLGGIWWLSPDDIHALFYVVGDSLYYTEEQQSPYLMELKESSLTLIRDSTLFKFEIRKLTGDSLVLYDGNTNEVTKLYKSTTVVPGI